MISDKWRYDEMLHTGVDFSDIAEVAAYDSYMQKLRDIGPEIDKIKTAVAMGSGDVVLDIGAGTGEMAIGLARHCQKVIAIDVSRAMIDYAARKAQERGCRTVVFGRAGFLTFEYPPEPLDVVISQLALHHLPDFWKFIALQRIYAALKPGGRLFLQDAVLQGDAGDYEKYFARVVGQIEAGGGEKVARDTEKTLRDEYVTLDWLMESLLRKAGFRIVSQEYAAPFVATYLCAK